MHGSDGTAPSGKSVKPASASTDAPLLESKTFGGSEIGSALTETYLNPSEIVTKMATDLDYLPKEEFQQLVAKNGFQRSVSPQIVVCEHDKAAIIRSETVLPEGFFQGRTLLCTDQILEEQVEEHIEPEERWESSPGFDVLVGDKLDNLEDDPEYLLEMDREHRELNSHFYDFEDSVVYDPAYPDVEHISERDIYDGFDHLDAEHLFTTVKRFPGHSRDKMLGSMLSRKRKLVPMELTVGDSNGMDLREHLRRRRVIDGRPIAGLSRRHHSSHLIGRSEERRRRCGMGHQLHGRLASEVGKNTIESHVENETFLLNGTRQHNFLRRSQQDRSNKQHFRKKRLAKRQFSSEVSKKSISRGRRSIQEPTTFTGPKTLAQIKQEKKKAEENRDLIWKDGHSSRTTVADFQGPKHLSEILDEKRKVDSFRDRDISGC